jgi:hypothetical protein
MALKQKSIATVLATIFALLMPALPAFATSGDGGDFFQQMGKMYVVVGCICLAFLGIVAFLLYIEKRISKLEKQIENNE